MGQRIRFLADERLHPWLTILVDVYNLAERVNDELMAACKRRGVVIACTRGCDSCCRNQQILVTNLELSGITWYVMEKLDPALRQQVRVQLHNSKGTRGCPFLVDGACSVYPVRPLTCRQFFVQRTPCSLAEEVNTSRPQDIVRPTPESVVDISFRLLDFWQITKKRDKIAAVRDGFIYQNMFPLQEVDWQQLLQAMADRDKEL
jgi:Fe-S-cluster containining protein